MAVIQATERQRALVKPDRPLTAQAKQLTLEPSNLVGYRSYKVYIELKELREQ